jgi:PAS domain S-box-containing protein
VRKLATLLGVLALALLPGGKAGAQGERVVLQLKWQHQFQFAGYYAAAANGYYRDAGLEVELREAVPGKDPVEEVLAGRANFGVGTSELALLRAQGRPVVVLAAIYQHSPLVLLARAEGGVGSLPDLHDKPLMIEPQSAELFAYFRNEGVDPRRLRVVHHTFRVDELLEGRVAAMSAYVTDEPFVFRQRGIATLTFTPRAGGIDFYGDNLFTTEAELQRDPARVRAFRAASLRGWAQALANPEAVVDLIRANYPTTKTREHLLYEAAETAKLMHPGLIEVGHMNPGRWQHIVNTYAEFGMLTRRFPLEGFLFDVGERPDLRWLYWSLAGAVLLAVVAFGWLLPLLRLNRKLRASERQFRGALEHAPFPVAITDPETSTVLFVNRRTVELFGHDESELVGERALNFYDDPKDRERLLAALRAGNGVASGIELGLHARDGRKIWAAVAAGTIEFHGQPALLIAFHDITERRAMEDELRRAKAAAEAADAAKSRYLGVLSHEVRTPLNGMLGMVDLLRVEAPGTAARENLDILDSAGRTLLKLVTDLLDFARFDAGKVDLESGPVHVAEFLRELTVLFRAGAEAKALGLRCTVQPDVPKVVVTDALRLRQVLSNLLGNAIKFTPRGTVEINVECGPAAAPESSGRCRLRFHVIDTGIGIPAEQLGRLFEPFVQANASVARQFGGSGLGLSISKRLAQILGGGIRVLSRPGEGSTFTLEIEVGIVADEATRGGAGGPVRAG